MKIALALIITLISLSGFAQTNVITSTNWTGTSATIICGKRYVGYINFYKTAANGWGYKTNSFPYSFTATNGNFVSYLGKFGDTGTNCNGTVHPPFNASAVYRFAIYFTNVQTKASGVLVGLNP